MPRYNFETVGDLQKNVFLRGTIQSIDSATDTCTVNVAEIGEVSALLFYHCEPDSVLRSNGAIEGAAAGFAVGDEVVVQWNVEYREALVVAHVDGARSCYWEPWNGPAINSKNPWVAYITSCTPYTLEFIPDPIAAPPIERPNVLHFHMTGIEPNGSYFCMGTYSTSYPIIPLDPLIPITNQSKLFFNIRSIKTPATFYAANLYVVDSDGHHMTWEFDPDCPIDRSHDGFNVINDNDGTVGLDLGSLVGTIKYVQIEVNVGAGKSYDFWTDFITFR